MKFTSLTPRIITSVNPTLKLWTHGAIVGIAYLLILQAFAHLVNQFTNVKYANHFLALWSILFMVTSMLLAFVNRVISAKILKIELADFSVKRLFFYGPALLIIFYTVAFIIDVPQRMFPNVLLTIALYTALLTVFGGLSKKLVP